jgi:hypothetical protein
LCGTGSQTRSAAARPLSSAHDLTVRCRLSSGPIRAKAPTETVFSPLSESLMLWYLFLACLVIVSCAGLFVKTLRRWFLAFGCTGVIIALALTAVSSRNAIKPEILLVLWPPAVAGLANPSTLSDKILVALFEFGGNFILYGMVGTLIGLCFRRKPSPQGLGTQ